MADSAGEFDSQAMRMVPGRSVMLRALDTALSEQYGPLGMGLLDRLSRLIAENSTAELRLALRELYIGYLHRTVQLEQHAKQAPHRYSMEALHGLLAAEQRHCERLRQAIEAAGDSPPEAGPQLSPQPASNHWARMVHDLEAHRISVQQFREAAVRFGGSFPETAALFHDLCLEESGHCRDLRELIARADPQALD